MPIVWTDELKDRVKALWPTHSSREISDTLSGPDGHVSRQSISSLASRLGLTAEHKTRETATSNPFGMLSDGRLKKPPVQQPLINRFYAEDVSETNVHGLAALESHHCRFPVNADMAAPIYCGAQIVRGSRSWCQKHFERCHVARPVEERKVA